MVNFETSSPSMDVEMDHGVKELLVKSWVNETVGVKVTVAVYFENGWDENLT